jgi:hypothetical protein
VFYWCEANGQRTKQNINLKRVEKIIRKLEGREKEEQGAVIRQKNHACNNLALNPRIYLADKRRPE